MADLRPLDEITGSSTTVLERLVAVARAQPSVTAAGDGERQVSLPELLVEAAAVCAALAEHDPDRRPVAVLRDHAVDALVAIVGVIAAGAPLVVLDPTTPAARLRHHVETAGATLCLTDAAHRGIADEIGLAVVDAPARAASFEAAVDILLRQRPAPDQTALIVFTSGSTGRPKGVACSGSSVLHDAYRTATQTGAYGPGDIVANLLPMAFSAGIELALSALLTGADQRLFDPRTRPVRELPAWLLDRGVTVLVASPAILRGLVAAVPAGHRLEGLTRVTMAGETVHGAELAAIRSLVAPGCEIRNRYGSTETWMLCEFVLRSDDPAPVGPTPVGRPLAGIQLRVRDEQGVDAAQGTGRLVVTSRWTAAGYWGDTEKTAEVFTELGDGVREVLTNDRAVIDGTGCVQLLGRTDHSVKIRGHLVEPGEVDAVLFAQPEIREAVVVGVTVPGAGRTRLVAYVVPAGPRVEASWVRRVVREQLPAFMVPEQVILLPRLPRTDRGKLDRSALPPAPSPDLGERPPRTDWERVVAGLFARVLGVDVVGLEADFFALGGDSLAAEELLAAVAGELDVPSDVACSALLVEAPTVEAFAEALRRRRRPAHPTRVLLREGGDRSPLFCIAGAGAVAVGFRPLVQRLPPDQPVYALQAYGLENRGLPDWSVEAMAARHLRAVRQVHPRGPYRLAGHSLGALVALEMAHRLISAGEEVELLAVLDSFPPDPARTPSAFDGGLASRLRQGVAILSAGMLPHRLGQYGRFHRRGMFLASRYRGRPWPGRALVVVAQDDAHAGARGLWDDHLTGPRSLVRVRGDHSSVLHEPFVVEVAEALAAELAYLDDHAM
jgi:acyl-coenzyme A synthetase/AMP-(fatty) acid ligase/thioesterase domain-containing protein